MHTCSLCDGDNFSSYRGISMTIDRQLLFICRDCYRKATENGVSVTINDVVKEKMQRDSKATEGERTWIYA